VDEMWWSVFGPGSLLWIMTGLALLSLLTILILLVVRRRKIGKPPRRPAPGLSIYLDEAGVMGLYFRDTYRPAMSREIERQITTTTSADVAAEVYGFHAGAERGVTSEVAERYVQEAEPIAVIRVVMNVLEEKDDIIYVDLLRGTVEPDRALHEELTRRDADLPLGGLAGRGTYLSVWGSFRELSRDDGNVSFAAVSAGDPAARTVFTCPLATVNARNMLAGPFMARCLGRAKNWDDERRELVIDPIAVFN
jgi:hypothetical protein